MNRITQWATKRWVLTSAAGLLLYTLIGFLLLPFLVRHFAPGLAADYLKRPAAIREVHFNPFCFTLEAKDVALNETDGQPVLGLKRLFLNFEPTLSLFRWAIAAADLRLEGLSVNLVLDPEGNLNVTKIVDSLATSEESAQPPPIEPPPADEPPLRMLLKHITVADGEVKFTDLSRSTPLTQKLGDIQLEIHGISTLPGRYGTQRVEAQLADKGKLAWTGDISLNPVASNGEVKVEGFRLATQSDFFRDRTNLAAPTGEIDMSARYQFSYIQGKTELTVQDAAFKLAGLGLATADQQEPLLALDEVAFAQASVDLAARTVRVPSFAVRKGTANVTVDEAGKMNWQTLVRPEPAKAAPQAAAPAPEAARPATEPPQPATAAPEATLPARETAAPAPEITAPASESPAPLPHPPGAVAPTPESPKPASATPEATTPAAEPTPSATAAAVPGSEPSEPAQPWKVLVERFEISELGINYADARRKLPFAVSIGDFGLSLGTEAEIGAGAPKARVDNLAVRVDRVALARPDQPAPLFGWDSLEVQGGRLDLEKREATIQSVAVKGGGVAIVREADGALSPLDAFAAKSPNPPAPSTEAEKPGTAQPEGAPWQFALDEFSLQEFGVALTDRTLSPAVVYNLDGIQAVVKSVTRDGKTPLSFDVNLKIREGGALQASGTASPRGDAARAKIKLERVDLKPLQPILNRLAALRVESADVSTDLDVDFRQGQPKPSIQVTGGTTLDGLLVRETKDNKHFLSWKRLAVNGIEFGLAPDSLSVKEVRILDPYANIVIFEDKSTNIAAILTPQEPEASTPTPSVKSESNKPASAQPLPLAIERVRVSGGLIDFSDASLVLPFAIRIRDFGGAVTGISLAPKARATLKFEGNVDPYGEVKVDGSLSPLQLKGFSEIKAVFRNIEMTSLSPYSATFAGRKIESGKLNLELDYKIENSKLTSLNHIVLEQFTLGERIESPNAVSLPLDLAIALLTDSEGKIRASVPIEGDVDNPTFAYRKLVWDALVTLVKRVVTAPFRAIASAFGGSEEQLDTVSFEPAKDVIPPPEREKLGRVAQALAQRPKLKLTIHGRYNPKLDGEALRSLGVRRALAEKMGVDLAPVEEPGAVSFGDATTQRALEKLAHERGEVGEAVQADYVKKTGKAPQRVGAMAGLMGRASETPEFYEKLFQKLVETAPLPPEELDALAARRGAAVLTELVDQQHFDPARVAIGNTESTDHSTDGNVPTQLDLSAE